MQRSSDSIGKIAAALAKAQPELVNPEKSLAATVRGDGRGGADQTFRYAPLSSGLDIVRKTLGQHEIAAFQTTSIDQAAGLVSLTTVLAHSSGEWIASDWPVCAISETAAPRRMGAALTYARRYALFTLVGIAGEDDLDAPDLPAPTNPTSGPDKTKASGNGQLNGGQHTPDQQPKSGRDSRSQSKTTKPILRPEASAELRERMIVELSELGSGDAAATWAHRCLIEKNRLTAADAQRVEESFRAKLATLPTAEAPQSNGGTEKNRPRSDVIDKSALKLPEPRRIRDRDHVKSVTQHPCLILRPAPFRRPPHPVRPKPGAWAQGQR
jgi:hypothetical protein